ncbi:MAG: hypothetical protein KAT16_07465 [Candidatus Heimdallarchaeota archaeon]|nr:hypothetical protein [Candidatus Heimdallarchaeota archaeon]
MSYIEKAFWDYLKSTLFGGLRILLSRQFIFFSVVLFFISISTTGLVFMQEQASDVITPDLIELVFGIQISLAIGFIFSGLVSKKLSSLARFLIMFVVVVVVSVINEISALSSLSDLFLQTIPLIAFLCWSFLIPVASFSFAKGMFSNKVTGSIVFLGKPRTERKSVFSGLLTLVAFTSVIGNLIMIAIGINDTPPRTSYIFLGLLGLGISVFIILIVQGIIFSDDVFNTVLGLFFVMTLPNQLMIVLTSVSGSENIVTSFDFILVTFALLYSAQNISRRVNLKGVIVDESGDVKNLKSDDPFGVGRVVGFIGGEGIVLIYLGLALGFHLIQLQVINRSAGIYEELFGALTFSEAYHDITTIFTVFIFVIVTLTYFLQRGRGYWEADIVRFEFLPPYEDIKDYMEKVKSGEISKTDIAISVGKKAVNVGGAGVFSAARIFRDKIFKGSEKEDDSK